MRRLGLGISSRADPGGYKSLWVKDEHGGVKDLRQSVEAWWVDVWNGVSPEDRYPVLIQVAGALVDLGDYDAAIPTAQRAASLFPERSEAFFIVSEAYWRSGHPRSALKTLIDGFRRRPAAPDSDDIYPLRLYTRLLIDVGWHYEAMQVVNDCLQDFPEDQVFKEMMKESLICYAATTDQGYHM